MSIHTRVVNDPLPATASHYKVKFEGGPFGGIVGRRAALRDSIRLENETYRKDRCEGEYAIYKWVQP